MYPGRYSSVSKIPVSDGLPWYGPPKFTLTYYKVPRTYNSQRPNRLALRCHWGMIWIPVLYLALT